MMISPEVYYEQQLKGKTKEQIMRVIRGLKQEIGHLKNMMENPDYAQESVIHPSEGVRLDCTREYLGKAKQAYTEVGGIYSMSKAEEKAAGFELNMNSIFKITFGIGGFFGGYRSYVVEISDNLKAYTKLWEDEESLILFDNENEEPFTKDAFLAALANFHIGEWRRRYTTLRFGYTVCDGTQWELEFEYNNGHKPVRFDGDNAYPYNFNKLKMLFGIFDVEEHEEEADAELNSSRPAEGQTYRKF